MWFNKSLRYNLQLRRYNMRKPVPHQVGEGKTATLRIEAPEVARKPVTTIGIDPRHPLTGGLEVNFAGELSLGRGEVSDGEDSALRVEER